MSLSLCGPFAAVPPRGARFLAEPVVPDDPDALAVPRLFVPGGGSEATVPELSGVPGLLAELLMPPVLAGLEGAVVTPDVPAPVEPLGEPTALPAPDVPALPPPALPPPAPPPPV